MKTFIVIFAILCLGSIVAAFWNPCQIVVAFFCLLMVINGIGHIKESV